MLFGSTRGAVNHLVKMAKRVAFVMALVAQFLYIIYLVYITVKDAGIIGVNITMGVLSVGYLIYFLIMEYRLSGMSKEERKAGRKVNKTVKKIYRFVKLTFKTMNLGIMFYGLWASEAISTTVSTIFTTLMIIVWIVELIIALGSVVISYVADVIMEAIEDDKNVMADKVKEPGRALKKVGNRFKRFFGFGKGEEEPEEEERYVRDERFVRWEEELKEDKAREEARK